MQYSQCTEIFNIIHKAPKNVKQISMFLKHGMVHAVHPSSLSFIRNYSCKNQTCLFLLVNKWNYKSTMWIMLEIKGAEEEIPLI